MLKILEEYIWILFISMLPVIELRGAIPVGLGMGLDFWPTFIIAIIGNIIPVIPLIFFSKKILFKLSGIKKIGTFFQKIIDRAERKAKNLGTYEYIGLLLFVGIPLPGTGAWTGSLIAALLGMKVGKAFWAISAGVVLAGIIMSLASAGVFGALSKFLSY